MSASLALFFRPTTKCVTNPGSFLSSRSVNAVHKIDHAYRTLSEDDFVPCGNVNMTISRVWGLYATEYWN